MRLAGPGQVLLPIRTRLPGPEISRRKHLYPLGAFLLAACATPVAAASPAAEVAAPVLAASGLGATRAVTMYWPPTVTPSSTVMALSCAPDKKVMSSFHPPDFPEGEYSLRGDTIAFAAVTAGGEALFSHSGRFLEGRIAGQTLSHGRDFLMIWVATRRAQEVPPAP
ncbi:MAG: hypothetical protein GC196_05100 [Hyphomonas sp.]|nr:hypothetical protein [Hyphomonas sp.]